MNGKKIAYKYDVAKFLEIGYGIKLTLYLTQRATIEITFCVVSIFLFVPEQRFDENIAK